NASGRKSGRSRGAGQRSGGRDIRQRLGSGRRTGRRPRRPAVRRRSRTGGQDQQLNHEERPGSAVRNRAVVQQAHSSRFPVVLARTFFTAFTRNAVKTTAAMPAPATPSETISAG